VGDPPGKIAKPRFRQWIALMSQFPADRRETWITGIGLVSSLGGGLEANWDALRSGRANIDLEKYAPWMIHPLAPLNLDSQILIFPRKNGQG
jgi:3-oxoacyl-[acyl-carrier-protein] synthase II